MARSCTGSNYLSGAPINTLPAAGSLFVRFKPNWSGQPADNKCIFRMAGGAYPTTLGVLDLTLTGNLLYVGFYAGGGDRRMSIGPPVGTSFAGIFQAGVWVNLEVNWWATGLVLYVNGVAFRGISLGAGSPPTNFTALTIGQFSDVTGSADGSIAEIAIFDTLSLTERDRLQATGDPSTVPSGLLFHWKLLGDDSPEPDEIGSHDLTVVGTPAKVTHPPITAVSGSRACYPGASFLASSPADWPTTGTFFIRFRPNWTAGDGVTHSIFRSGRTLPSVAVFDLQVYSVGNTLYAGWYAAPADWRVQIGSFPDFRAGSWIHFRIDWDQSTGVTRVYVDGAFRNSFTSLPMTVPGGFTSLGVGYDFDTGGYSADGDIACIGVWDHLFDAEEVQTINRTGDPSMLSAGLAHNWQMDGSGSTEPDTAGGDDLTAIGNPVPAPSPVKFPLSIEPDDVNGLGLWLRADALALADNANVSAWVDESPNAWTFTPETSTTPIFKADGLNALPAVRFSDSPLIKTGVNAVGTVSSGQSVSAYVVIKIKSTHPNGVPFFWEPGSPGANRIGAIYGYGPGAYFDFGTDTGGRVVGPLPTGWYDTWQIIEYFHSGADFGAGAYMNYVLPSEIHFIRADGVLQGIVRGVNMTPELTPASGTFWIGGTDGTGNEIDADVGEILFYKGSLQPVEREALRYALWAKWFTHEGPGARLLTAGNRLNRATITGRPLADSSIFLRIKPTWSSGDSISHQFFEYAGDSGNVIILVKHSDNNIYAGIVRGGTSSLVIFADPGLFTAGVWANWQLDMNGSGGFVALYKDGVAVAGPYPVPGHGQLLGTNVSLVIGDQTTTGRPADAHEAEFAEWDHILSSTDRGTVNSTGNPACVPAGLVRHYHCGGYAGPVEFDLVGADDLTVIGSPAITTPPPISSCAGGGPQSIDLAGLVSALAIGTPSLQMGAKTITLAGVESGVVVGEPALQFGPWSILLAGVESAEAIGAIAAQMGLRLVGVESAEAFGDPSIAVGPAIIELSGVESGEAIGDRFVVWIPGTESPRRMLRVDEDDRTQRVAPDDRMLRVPPE